MTDRSRIQGLARSDAFVNAPVAYSILDADGRQVGANAAFHDLFRTEQSLVRVEDITHPDEVERTSAYLRALAEGASDRVVVDKRYLRADGTVFWGRLTATPLLDDGGRPELLLGVIEDITTQVEALAQLTAVSNAKSEFVARVSHDLRAPLHAIGGLAELLVRRAVDEDGRRLAEGITREADALRALVDDLLDLSRVEAGRIDLHPAVFSLSRCVEGSVGLVRARAEERGLELAVTIAPGVDGDVWGDADRLRQVLVNLVDNAVKFTRSGSVRVDVLPAGGDEVDIEVSDTGPGIAPEDIERIFEAFAQSHDDQSGTGLGLTISRDLADAMGGSLTVRSEPGVGSVFTVRLPLPRKDIAGASPDIGDAADGQRRRPTVLVVEDSPVNRLLVASQLDQLGYDHELAVDGFQALEAVAARQFDLVFMDWHLPGIDGLETTRRLRRFEERSGRPRVPIVAVTARTMSGDRQRCLDAGMDDLVAKPAGLDDLGRALRKWLSTGPPPAGEAVGAGDDDGAVTDLGALERLVDELGDGTIVATLVRTFLAELPGRRDAIRRGAAAGDLEQVRRAAHTLKSTSDVVGATTLAELSRELEGRAMAGEGAIDGTIDDAVRRLDEAVAAATTGLQTVLTKLEGP